MPTAFDLLLAFEGSEADELFKCRCLDRYPMPPLDANMWRASGQLINTIRVGLTREIDDAEDD